VKCVLQSRLYSTLMNLLMYSSFKCFYKTKMNDKAISTGCTCICLLCIVACTCVSMNCCCTCCVYLLYYVCIAGVILYAELLARIQYSECPTTGHLDAGFYWFPCVYELMLRWFPRFQVATTCFSCSPPDLKLNVSVTSFIFFLHVK
jgi:hypothetical protein